MEVRVLSSAHMYKEIETLVEVLGNKNELDKFLRKTTAYEETASFVDTYYFDPTRPELTPDREGNLKRSFRIRSKGENAFRITYKIDQFALDGGWLYSDELETNVGDASVMSGILEQLGLKELATIRSSKHFFKTDQFSITLEEVESLGVFVEVESRESAKVKTEGDIKTIKQRIHAFITSLPVKMSDEIEAGKLGLFLEQHATGSSRARSETL